MWAGVDVGAHKFHAVVIDDRRVVASAVFDAADGDGLAQWLGPVAGVGVDSPGAWSTAPHAEDGELAPKFRHARCGEVDLGRTWRIWVPWPTPTRPAPGTWMAAGISLFDALRATGHDPVEAFPYAGFRLLAGMQLPKKTTPEGRTIRVRLLRQSGVHVDGLERSHDFLDAALLALVARHRSLGTARVATCGHDDSAIWLPAVVSAPSGRSRRGRARTG